MKEEKPVKLVTKEISIRDIRMSEQHWERTITEADIDDLGDNIAVVGQIHPLLVRPVGKAKRIYELIAGERRFRALKKIGAKTASCRVGNFTDEQAKRASYSENMKIKSPTSKEWAHGARVLADMWEAAHPEVDEPKPKSTVPSALKGKPGRKKTVRAKAHEAVAKELKVNPKTVERARIRDENLIISAANALEGGKISIEQANRLAHMTIKEQKRELPKMIMESQAATTKRLKTEQKAQEEGVSAVARETLDELAVDCREIVGKVKTLLGLMDGKEVDYPMLRRADLGMLAECQQQLGELLSFVG